MSNRYNRLIIVPEHEVYSFSKKLFFYIFNTEAAPFMSKTITDLIMVDGYTVFPFNKDNNEDYKLILAIDKRCTHNIDRFTNNIIDDCKMLIIITDDSLKVSDIDFDDTIDLSNLLNYYNADLSFDELSKYIISDKTE